MQVAVFETLADPTRRHIIELLAAGEQPVNALVAGTEINQSGVSRHLRILREAGFVKVRADGQQRLYSLQPEPFDELGEWLEHYRNLWLGRLDALGDAIERRRAYTGRWRLSPAIVLERAYRDVSLDEMWELWTTAQGIEDWWGPGDFSVEVTSLDLRPGGVLEYTMLAVSPQAIAALEAAGRPIRTPATVTFTDVQVNRRLAYVSRVDFVPDVEPYDVSSVIEFEATADGVRVKLSFDSMHNDEWTTLARAGHSAELSKLASLLSLRPHG